MLWITVRASLAASVWDAWPGHAANPWAVATLYDPYFCWVVYKAPSWIRRALWFVIVMGLGNITSASYVLIELFLLAPGEPVHAVLRRHEA